MAGAADAVAAAEDAAAEGAPLPEEYSCMFCHGKEGMLADDQETQHLIVTPEHMAGDVHWKKGLRCHDCHGGNPLLDDFEDHRDDTSFRSMESPDKAREFCGRCHFDAEFMHGHQHSRLADGHGQRLDKNEDPKVATCVSCHGHHAMRPVDPLVSPENCVPCHRGHVPVIKLTPVSSPEI